MGKNKSFPCSLTPDMYCIDFFCVVYSRFNAFGKKRENKTHRKIIHSTVEPNHFEVEQKYDYVNQSLSRKSNLEIYR